MSRVVLLATIHHGSSIPMTKTRTLQLLALATSAVIAGCTANETSLNATLAPEPGDNLVYADTTQPTRDWPQSISYIANGDTQADGTTGFRYRSADNLAAWQYPIVEPGVFAANIVTAPYTLIAERDRQHVSAGLQFPPSHTMMPPLPDSPNIAPEAPPTPPVVEQGVVDLSESPTTAPAADLLIATTDRPEAPAFTIAGQVLKPGTYDATNMKLSQVVAAAGPAAEDTSKVRVQIDRPGEESATTTLDQLISGAVEDITLKSGDVITVSVLP